MATQSGRVVMSGRIPGYIDYGPGPVFDVGDVVRSAYNPKYEYTVACVKPGILGLRVIGTLQEVSSRQLDVLKLVRPAKWRVGDVLHWHNGVELRKGRVTGHSSYGVGYVDWQKYGAGDVLPPSQSTAVLVERPGVTLYADASKAVATVQSAAAPAVCPECKGDPAFVYISLFGDRHNCGLCGGGGA